MGFNRQIKLYPSSFCVSVAGFRPAGSISDAIFLPSYATHTLHVLGRTDVIVVEERSKKLLDVSSNQRVEFHDGGKGVLCIEPRGCEDSKIVYKHRSFCALKGEMEELPPRLLTQPRRFSSFAELIDFTASFGCKHSKSEAHSCSLNRGK